MRQQTPVLWQQALHKTHIPHALSPEDGDYDAGPARQMGLSFRFKVCSDLQGTKQSRNPTNFLVLLNRFRCKVCALCKGARAYRRSMHVQLHGPHKTPKAVPAPGDIVFCNSNDDSTIGVVTATLLDDLFTVLMPTQHT